MNYTSSISKLFLLAMATIATSMLLQGCSLWKQDYSETFILDPPKEEEQQTVPSVMDIKTIYPVLDHDNEGFVIGWNSNNSLISLNYDYIRPKAAYDQSKGPYIRVEQINQPYVSRVKLLDLQVSLHGWKGAVLSPKGNKIAHIANTDDKMTLSYTDIDEPGGKLYSLKEISDNHYVRQLNWSQNNKYLTMLIADEENHSLICVYDTETTPQPQEKCYNLDNELDSFHYISIYISDDGTTAALIRYINQNKFQLEYGKLQDESFQVKYMHPTGNYQNYVQWIHSDQIVFIGEDKKLYTYDQRNDSIAVLMEEVMQFKLSQDKQFIVFAKQDETIQIANLYGNNIVNLKQIYKGMDGLELLWSTDNKKIMVSGVIRERKTIELSFGLPSQIVIEFE